MKLPRIWKVDDSDWVVSETELSRVRRIRRNRRIDAVSSILAVVIWVLVILAAYYWIVWS